MDLVVQWQILFNILNNSKLGATEKLIDKCSPMHWNIDNSVFHHMIGRLECLSHNRDMIKCLVQLSNEI